jgi:hypothetical protein
VKRKKMMRWKEKLMTGLGFLPSPDVLYLYVCTNGPLQGYGPKYSYRLLYAAQCKR